MKWDNDPLIYEKYLIFDAIIEFSKTHEGKAFSEVSIKDLFEFVDRFFTNEKIIKNEENQPV